ncbi:hypothetical protein [Sphingobacterium sp. 1.A.4]|nr:hypothetical protein [Sphingobacterium sp. 1.A.4]
MLTFWDKTSTQRTLVVATHGFIKKQGKVPSGQIQKAKKLMLRYFKEKLT